MKYIFTLLLIAGSVHITLAQKSKPAPLITRFYQLTGSIDKYPITLNIHRKGNDFYGSYYYNSTEETIDLFGVLQNDGSLRLTNNNRESGDMNEEFSGKFKDSSFSGTWLHNGKVLPFRVTKPLNTNGLYFDYVITKGSRSLPKDQQFGRSEITYDAAAVCPTASSTHPATKLIREKIFEAFGYTSTNGTIGEAMLADKKDVLSQGGEIEKYGVSISVNIVYLSKQLLTLSILTWEDNGGAHGNYTIKYVNIDLVNNSEVGAVFNECAQLPALQEKKVREYFNASGNQKLSEFLLVDTLPTPNNCIITSKGITFSYDPYEIAAYAAGQIKLYIPFKEIQGCLTDEFKKLVGMNK
ncbi:RsiV family protein [Niastella sp. OAS944]|uniref:RsiV family protein n=1 Tax=Niastella sp. OAS944 TaxID=2664089 RepID=UPI003487A350|nr:hypothetical protein [Chitinophagaceae bacterium OAS944]